MQTFVHFPPFGSVQNKQHSNDRKHLNLKARTNHQLVQNKANQIFHKLILGLRFLRSITTEAN